MEHDPNSKLPDDDSNQASPQISESRMRQALGIDPRRSDRHTPSSHGPTSSHGTNAPRRRFVADGDVPVVMIGRRRDHAPGERADQAAALSDRVSAVESALATERDARLRAEALLADARHTIQQMQTQMAHADLARDEAITHARRAMADRAEALQKLETAQNAQPQDEPAPAHVEPAPVEPPAPARPAPIGRPRRIDLPASAACDVPAYTAQILAAYLARNALSPAELPGLANSVLHALVSTVPASHAQPAARMMEAEPRPQRRARQAVR
jgi:hypothetical protein